MILKTYRARTMGDALAEVKKDLGKDAVILHTRAYKVGGWLGFGGRPMVEITASDAVNVVSRERKKSAPPATKPALSHAAARAYGLSNMPPPPAPAELETLPVVSRQVADAAREVIAAVTAPAASKPDGVSPALDAELAAIKRLVGQVLQCSRQTALKSGPAAAAGAGFERG